MFKIIKKEKITSTNTWAKENIQELADKTVVSANQQTLGRGRFVRKWVSDNPNNIYMSFVLKPQIKDNEINKIPLANLTQYLAVCVVKVLEKYKVNPKIKWPNDIIVNDKKIAGILAELIIKKGMFQGLVLGLGLNLDMTNEELKKIDKPATALNVESSVKFTKEDILNELINTFFSNYEEFLVSGFASIRKEYLKYFYLKEKTVKINLEFKFVEGKIIDVNEKGLLILQDNSGEVQEISIGDIL